MDCQLPALIVTVDTEEEGLWGGVYRREVAEVENLKGLDRFQQFCLSYGVRPTYLVDQAVVECPWAVKQLANWQEKGHCEVGAHLHPWCTPPFEEELGPTNSYVCNLPETLQRSKLQTLTEAITQQFGRRPLSFRAGRYGMGTTTARILAELGYKVDSSVLPFRDLRADGGPDYSHAPWQPYWPSAHDLCKPASKGMLLEVPVLVGYSWANFHAANQVYRILSSRPWRWFRLPGLLDRLGLLQRIVFSPEKSTAERLVRLVRVCLRQGVSCLVLMLHSSSLWPGCSPYVPNREALEEIYLRLKRVFEFCNTHKIRSVTLAEFAAAWEKKNNCT